MSNGGIQSWQCACVLSHDWLCAIPCTAACQIPLSMEFSRLEYWSELPFPPPRDLPNTGIKPTSTVSPELAGIFFYRWAIWEAQYWQHVFVSTVNWMIDDNPQESFWLTIYKNVQYSYLYYCNYCTQFSELGCHISILLMVWELPYH